MPAWPPVEANDDYPAHWHPEGYIDAFRNVIAESWRSMRGEAVTFPTFADGLGGVELVEQALASAKAAGKQA